jgi:parallel beta-helix repeat protein
MFRAERLKGSVTIAIALLLWAGMAVGIYEATTGGGSPGRLVSGKAIGKRGPLGFNHSYPPNPVDVERPKVTGRAPEAPKADVVSKRATISSFQRLAAFLPRGVVIRRGASWLIARPVAVEKQARLLITGPGRLDIGPGAFLLAGRGGVIVFRNLTVTGVDGRGEALSTPRGDRGFLAARRGGRLWLDHVVVSSLGHSAVQAYGISFQEPAAGSGVVDSTITNNYFGIYTTHAVAVQILRNRVSNSWVYGIDPHTASSNLLIEGNQVSGSGVHGIVLADRVTSSRVLGNVVTGSKDHGIVVFDRSDHNVVQSNTVSQTFDGIVVQDSSSNRIADNVVGPVARFGIRVAGQSDGNAITQNTVSNALVGAFLYAGASGNSLLDNTFSSDSENVRVRPDAPGNEVRPIPPRSEL